MMLKLPQPYLLFLGDATEPRFAKTAFGLKDWAPERCVGELALPESTVTLGMPSLTPIEAYRRGARALVIGVASPGGALLPSWIPTLVSALEAGLDLISGMHAKLANEPQLKDAAERNGRRLIDVRSPPPSIPLASGRKRTGNRLLTVGVDCAVGKKYTALTLASEFRKRGVPATFRASGQTGILIAGAGMPIDAVIADFVAGAAEALSPAAAADHWDVVEGQGSLSHPAYAGVSVGLLHGTQPDVLVVCHELGRPHMVGFPHQRLPSIEETVSLNLTLGRVTNPRVRCGGVSLNTSSLSDSEARAALAEHRERLRMPVADPLRGGPELEELVTACLAG